MLIHYLIRYSINNNNNRLMENTEDKQEDVVKKKEKKSRPKGKKYKLIGFEQVKPISGTSNTNLIRVLDLICNALKSGTCIVTNDDLQLITDFITANCLYNTKMDVTECYRYLGISRRHFYMLIERGKIKPAEYKGNRPYFYRTHIEKLKARYYPDKKPMSIKERGEDDKV